MAIRVEFRPEVEAWIQEEAQRNGVTPGEAVSSVIEAYWSSRRQPSALSEGELLSRIGEDFSAHFWTRYRPLYRKLRDETLGEAERQEFLRLHQQVEAKNVERMTLLAQLAAERGVTLPEIMRQTNTGPVQMPSEESAPAA